MANLRQTGDTAQISAKERDIAYKIQKAVSKFSYESDTYQPVEILDKQLLNCVGASTLGGALLEEAGIKYLVGGVPRHSILVLITNDEKAWWLDMLHPQKNEEITDEIIQGKTKNGRPLTAQDIAAYAKQPAAEGLRFNSLAAKKMISFQEGESPFLEIYPPEIGQQVQVLSSLGAAFIEEGNLEEAAESLRQAIAIDPKSWHTYHLLGYALKKLGRYEESIKAFRQAVAIDQKNALTYDELSYAFFKLRRYDEAAESLRQATAIDPKNVSYHRDLGDALFMLDRFNEAVEAYNQAITIDPKNAIAYGNLGATLASLQRYDEAIKALQTCISLADNKKHANLIQVTEQNIKEIQKYLAGLSSQTPS